LKINSEHTTFLFFHVFWKIIGKMFARIARIAILLQNFTLPMGLECMGLDLNVFEIKSNFSLKNDIDALTKEDVNQFIFQKNK
jgi:hypothetical protein